MALSVKVAMLTCLGFISSMCWLVNGVARPVVELPSPLAPPWSDADAPDIRPPAPNFLEEAPVTASTELALVGEDRLAIVPHGETDLVESRADLPPLVPRASADEFVAGAEPSATELVSDALSGGEPLVAVIDAALPEGAPDETEESESGDASAASTRTYRVKKGDTLAGIARSMWGQADAKLIDGLVAANPALSARRNRILVNEELQVPTQDEALRLAAAARTPKSGATKDSAADTMRSSRWYVVRANDSLVEIARRELRDSSRWREIAKMNGLSDGNRIRKGARIRLP